MLQDLIKALNEFLSSLGIKETITQHEDISITERAFNVQHNPDDKDIVVIGGHKLDGAFGYILTIGTSQYAISADQYRRLEYFNRVSQLHDSTTFVGQECYPGVEVIDPLFDPVHGYMADNARRANENPYMRTRSGLFGESLKPRLVAKGTEHVDPNLGTALGYSPDLDEYVSETPYVRKDLTPEQLEQLQSNIEENHPDNRVGIIGTRDLKAGGIPMDAMNMLMAHKVIEK